MNCPFCKAAIPDGVGRCPRCQTELAEADSTRGRARVEATVLESVADIRSGGEFQRTPTVKEQQPGISDAMTFRPILRPPVAILCIVDDGTRETSEMVRIRTEALVIGRTDGDVIIPHDNGISGRHAEISRQSQDGQYRWYLTDLESTNGTFIRIANSVLKHNQELLLGGRRYRFNAAPQGAASLLAAADGESVPKGSTLGWQAVSPASLTDLLPSLVELTPAGDGPRSTLSKADQWVGSSGSQSSVVLSNDPFLSPRHARIYKDERDKWRIESTGSTNGTWLRIEQFPLDTNAEFQLGEQRFKVLFPK